MKTKREELLAKLESIAPGLDKKEEIEQSDCFVFADGKIATFNDEIACSCDDPLEGVAGAVKAEPLLNLLRKLDDDEVEVEQKEGELLVKTSRKRRSGITMENEVLLPVDAVGSPEGDDWKALPDQFCDAVAVVRNCAGKDESHFVLTCVHLCKDHVETCDNFQAARHPLKLPLESSILIRATSLKHVTELGVTEFAATDSWLHFRNGSGLVLSCRKYAEEYPSLDGILDVQGVKTQLPGGLAQAAEKAEIFSADNVDLNQVELQIKSGKLKIKGRGVSGWYEEVKDAKYDGEPIKFLIDPSLLVELTKRTSECEIDEGRLKIDGGDFVCVISLGKAD